MKAVVSSIGILIAASVFGSQAEAATSNFSFSGGTFSGNVVFTYSPDVSPTDPNPLCGTVGNNPCRADPVGAYAITGVTGTFSDTSILISNATITGLIPINPANERDLVFDPLVPTSLSFVEAGLSYNNLFFPTGSPIDCDYPFTGTLLDVFGVAFTIAGGDTVNLWGDGAEPGLGKTYGVGVAKGDAVLDYQFDGVGGGVPEPATWSLMIAGFGLAGARLRRRRAVAQAT
jgi:hypothetical protein